MNPFIAGDLVELITNYKEIEGDMAECGIMQLASFEDTVFTVREDHTAQNNWLFLKWDGGSNCYDPRQFQLVDRPLSVLGNTLTLPTDAKARKALPIATGFLDYFPDAIVAVADLSRAGNEQHNPGKPLHWDRSKSGDEGDALSRHFLERGTLDSDGIRHSAKVAWRAMALLQKEIENETV